MIGWGLFAGLFVSTLGDEVALVALLFKLTDANSSGIAVAGLFAAQLIPMILLSPIAGKVVDQFETSRVAVTALFCQAALIACLIFANSAVFVISIAFLLGCSFAVSGPAVFSLLPKVAELNRITIARTNSIMEFVRGAGTLIGPIIGGVLVATGGTSFAFALDAVTFTVVALLIIFSGVQRRPKRVQGAETHNVGMFDGARLLYSNKILLLLISILAVVVFSSSVSDVVYIFLVRNVLDGGSVVFGVLVASWGLGMLGGSLLGGTSLLQEKAESAAFAGAVLMGLALTITGVFPVLIVIILAFIIGGFANGVHNVAVRNLLHTKVEADLHGRVFAIYVAVSNVAILLGFLMGGLLGAQLTLLTYIISGILTISAGVVGLYTLASLSAPIRTSQSQ